MAEVQTKALFTCTEAGYDAALSIMELYRKNGMQAFFYGIEIGRASCRERV